MLTHYDNGDFKILQSKNRYYLERKTCLRQKQIRSSISSEKYFQIWIKSTLFQQQSSEALYTV